MYIKAAIGITFCLLYGQQAFGYSHDEPKSKELEARPPQTCRTFDDDNALQDDVRRQDAVEVGGKMSRSCRTGYAFKDNSTSREFLCVDDDLWDEVDVCQMYTWTECFQVHSSNCYTSYSVYEWNANTGGCFQADGKVLTKGGHHVALKDLADGQYVLTVTESGHLRYQAVTLAHRQPNAVSAFVEVVTDGSKTLQVTPQHLLLVGSSMATSRLVPAKFLDIGDDIMVLDHDSLIVEKVKSKRLVQSRGMFAPMTSSGTVIVNTIVASTYVADTFGNVLDSPSLQHSMTWAIRVLEKTVSLRWTFVEPFGVPLWVQQSVDFFRGLSAIFC